MNAILKTTALVLSLSLGAPAAAVAQGDPELKPLADYRLTVANVGKVKAALDKAKLLKDDPPTKQDDESYDMLIRRLEQHREWGPILRGVGISGRDFVMTLSSVIATALVMGMTEGASAQIPAELRAHHKFMIEHEQAVKPLIETVFGDSK